MAVWLARCSLMRVGTSLSADFERPVVIAVPTRLASGGSTCAAVEATIGVGGGAPRSSFSPSSGPHLCSYLATARACDASSWEMSLSLRIASFFFFCTTSLWPTDGYAAQQTQ
eukprot:6289095-Prymnesium_polylepis.1